MPTEREEKEARNIGRDGERHRGKKRGRKRESITQIRCRQRQRDRKGERTMEGQTLTTYRGDREERDKKCRA